MLCDPREEGLSVTLQFLPELERRQMARHLGTSLGGLGHQEGFGQSHVCVEGEMSSVWGHVVTGNFCR